MFKKIVTVTVSVSVTEKRTQDFHDIQDIQDLHDNRRECRESPERRECPVLGNGHGNGNGNEEKLNVYYKSLT